MDEDPTYLPLLSRKYREALPPVIEQRRVLGKERFEREVIALGNLLAYGKFLQASNDPMLDLQRVASGDLVQINVLGTAMARFDYIWTPALREELAAKYSIHIKRQPNSTTISKDQVNKGLPIQYLAMQKQREDTDLVVCTKNGTADSSKEKVKYCWDFLLSTAIGFGDHPNFTDYPMTQFPPMPFVSVAQPKVPEQAEWPYKTRVIHLPIGEEAGTAEYLTQLVDFCVRENGERCDVAKNWWRPEFADEVGRLVIPK